MLLICGAMLPDFETGTTTQADVLIRDGRFAAIASHLEADCPIVEASGLLMLPGMADLHTHMVQSLTQGPLDDLNITQWLTRMLRAQWSAHGGRVVLWRAARLSAEHPLWRDGHQ